MITIKKAIKRIPEWQGKEISITPLSGGITNHNFKIKVNDDLFFVSLAGDNTQLLDVDWHNKFYNGNLCGQAGIAPKVIHHIPQQHLLVLQFLPFTLCSAPSLQQLATQRHLIHTIKILHNGAPFWQDFNMFHLITRYATTIKEQNLNFPIGYATYHTQIEAAGKALAPYRKTLVPCHNDLVPENMMADGERIYLLDFDYSGNNDPCFDLGSISVEAGYDDTQIRQLANMYYGQANEQIIARIHLHGIMGNVGWSLWAIIQAQISSVEFDFRAYGVTRWQQAVAQMNAPSFDDWLQNLHSV